MFERFKPSRLIMVVGPQRSGTRICTKMIAHDTGHLFVPEEKYNTDSLNRFALYLNKPEKMVIQAPCLTRYAHLLAQRYTGIFVVMMRRPVEEIIASQERINWAWEHTELMRYWPHPEGARAAEMKYAFWEQRQKALLGSRGTEVQYHDLEEHPLWIPKEERKNFSHHQTSREQR